MRIFLSFISGPVSGIIDPDKQRYLTLREFKRLSSFPDDFIFASRKDGIEKMGNCVPPKFMYHIAKTIKENILGEING